MWIFTPFGFFSVVQKKGTEHLTVRARVGADLDRLRERYLPSLSATETSPYSDYRYRAVVGHAELGEALGRMAADLHYEYFKDEVARVQGDERAGTYEEVWAVLAHELQSQDRSGGAGERSDW